MANTVRLSDAQAAGTLLAAKPASATPGPVKNLSGSNTRLDQIRRAGCVLLFQYGYSGMTMRELAASLKIKAASLYYHFPSKQHILFDVMHATVSELFAGLREIAESSQDPSRHHRGTGRQPRLRRGRSMGRRNRNAACDRRSLRPRPVAYCSQQSATLIHVKKD